MSRPAIKRGFVPQWIFERGFSITQREVLLYVMMRGDCFENKSKMASALRIGLSTLRQTLNELVALQWLIKTTKVTNKKRANCYTLALVEGVRADEKRRSTPFAMTQPSHQTNAFLNIYSAKEESQIANDSKKQIPSKILTEKNEPRSGDHRGVPNGPQSREDDPQGPFKPEVVEDKAKPPKKRPARENPHSKGTGDWIAWMLENGHATFALMEGFSHMQVEHEPKPKPEEKWA